MPLPARALQDRAPKPTTAPPTSGLYRSVSEAIARNPGNSGVFLVDTGLDALSDRDTLIDAAEHSIDAQYYIWNSDASGRYLAGRLLAAAERGVHVRILLDDINIAGRDAALSLLAEQPNIEIRIYNPSAARSGAGRLLGFMREFSRLNRRMHNKSFTADGIVTIVGGRNVGDEYFDLDPEKNFRDREILAAGPVVADVTMAFEAFWNSIWTLPVGALNTESPAPDALGSRRAALDMAGTEVRARGYAGAAGSTGLSGVEGLVARLLWAPARLVYDPPPTREDIKDSSRKQPVAEALGELAARAQREILIESAYFILGDDALAEARRLTAKGVRIRALTNSLASNDLVTNHSGYARRRLAMLESGLALYELRPDAAACQRLITTSVGSAGCTGGQSFGLHSKSIVVDRKTVYVGSFNVNLRSTYLNSETALIIDSPVLAEQIAASIEELMAPDSSWEVVRTRSGQLEWLSETDGKPVVEKHEPMTGFWRRVNSGFYRLFPLEKYL
jgi:putative cardiolipin synthase